MVVIFLAVALVLFVVDAIRSRSIVCAGLAFLTLAFLWPHLLALK